MRSDHDVDVSQARGGRSGPGMPANPRLGTLVALPEVFNLSVESLLPEQLAGIAGL